MFAFATWIWWATVFLSKRFGILARLMWKRSALCHVWCSRLKVRSLHAAGSPARPVIIGAVVLVVPVELVVLVVLVSMVGVVGVVEVVVLLKGARYQLPPPPVPRPSATTRMPCPVLVTRNPARSPCRVVPSPATLMPAGGTVIETRPSVTTRPTSEQPGTGRSGRGRQRDRPALRTPGIAPLGGGRAEAGEDAAEATSAIATSEEAAGARSRRVVMRPILPPVPPGPNHAGVRSGW